MSEKRVLRWGLDIGYSTTKGVGDMVAFKFPSIVGYAKELNFSLKEGNGSVGDEVEYNGKRYFIGNRSKHSDFQFQLKSRDWIEADIYAALMTSAFKRFLDGYDLADVEKIILVTGLPVNYMRDKEKAEQVVLKVFSNMGVKRDMVKVNVIPQPFGAFFHLYFEDDGRINRNAPNARRFGVLDVGHGTTDWILVENSRNYLERASGSVPIGTYTVYDTLSTAILNEFELDNFNPDEAESCIETRKVKVSGQTRDVSHIINNVLEQVGLRITGTVKSKWSSEGEIDLLLLDGGGAELLHNHLSSIAQVTLKAEEPQMANAKGYYKRAVIISNSSTN